MPGQYAQPTYPSMERQDLTQGQLGSFKFTPVDAPPSDTLGDMLLAAQAMMRERVSKLPQFVTADNQSEAAQSVASQLASQPSFPQSTSDFSFEPTPPPSALPKPDSEFFNTHIKPDLEESRLKLGPAAFRAAVDGNSPDGSLNQIRSRAESSSTTIATSPPPKKPDFLSSPPRKKTIVITSPSTKKPILSLASTPKTTFAMNPKAMSFDPATPASPGSDAESTIMPSYKSIVRCLESEQERHQHTKAKLTAVQARIKQLESLVEKLGVENANLQYTVKFLEDIIQNNGDKINKEDIVSLAKAGFSVIDFAEVHDKTPVQNGVKMTNGDHGKTGDETEITQDLTNGMSYKTEYFAKPQPVTPIKLRATDAPFVPNGHTQVNKTSTTPKGDTPVFNTGLLKNDEVPGTLESNRTMVLRKHFGADEADEISPTDTTSAINGSGKTGTGPDALASITNVEDVTPTKTTAKEESMASSDISQAASTTCESEFTSTSYPVKLQTADDPLFELPASFLAKYKKVVKKTDDDSTEFDSGNKPSEADDNGEPSLSLAPSLRSFEADVTAPQSPILVDPPAFQDLSIKWVVNNENPIFDEDDMDANFFGQPPRYGDEIFWQHPVRYLNYDSKNLFRTVMIDRIPSDATYLDVVSEIHAGSLEKIELVPAIGKVNDYQTARIVFNFELGASTTANYARDHGFKIKGEPVRVWQVLTQTYPKSQEVDEYVFQDGFTRMLLINNVSPETLGCLPSKLERFKSSIIDIDRTFDGYDYVEFTSVATAVKAMKHLMHDPHFRGAEFDFDEDPCGEQYPFMR